MQFSRVMTICSVILCLLAVTACSSNVQVQRMSADTTTDLSGRWNDTDSRLVAEKMIQEVLESAWRENFIMENSDKPVVIVGSVRNLSHEHIATDVFVKDIERELINSGKVRFVASSDERKEIRQERLEQQSFASEESAKRLAAETGADFILQGGIKTHIDAVDGKQVKFYQIDMELINIETNEKVWIGSKEIKKFVGRGKLKF